MSEGISLGWNCNSATVGVSTGLRKTKQQGYKTCPFDEMVTNYKGIIECIKDDFEFLCDINYLKLIKIPSNSKWLNTNGDGDIMIYNTKYNFIFNHESPGHANIFRHQKWPNGMNHFVMNDYQEFINRYKKRVQNIKELLNKNNVTFILTRPNTEVGNIQELTDVITKKYPLLQFNFVCLDCDKSILYDHLLLMKINENDNELKRLL